MNDLREFFYNRIEGAGIWKWDHYFDIYEKHFSKFRGTIVNVLEIGIYSGGSLEMWRDYFGSLVTIYGVDIQEECKIYADDRTRIIIGDQSDTKFWDDFKKQTPKMDIIIDDGSHKPRHQRTTFDSLFWDHLDDGGVYLCEDIHGYPTQDFVDTLSKEMMDLHYHVGFKKNSDDSDRRLVKDGLGRYQRLIKGFHTYPYVVVVEKNDKPMTEFVAPKRGTVWAPFKP